MKVVFGVLFALLTFNVLAAEKGGVEASVEKENLHYSLLLGSSKVGDFSINRTSTGIYTVYDAQSVVSVSLFGTINVEYTLHCVFENKRLKSSEVIFYRNGKKTDYTTIEWQGNNYQIDKNGKKSIISNPVYHSAVQLYFEEPTKAELILSEKEGCMMQMEELTAHYFSLLAADHNRDVEYTYVLNQLKEVKVNLTLTDFKMVRN